MRKFLLLILPLLFGVFISNAQYNGADDNVALQLVSANKAALGLSDADLSNVKVSNTYVVDNASGMRMVYLIQTHEGIPVHNQMLVLAFRNGKLVSNQGSFSRSVPKLANVKNGLPSVSAESAVQSALSDRGLQATQMAIALNTKENGHKIEFGNMGVSRENITAQLMWVPIEESINKISTVTKVQLAWEVYIIPKTTSDYWRIRVDATNNSILGMTNLTEYDNWGIPQLDNSLVNYPAFSYGRLLEKNDANNNLFDFKQSEDPNVITTATYRVVPFPAEAPSFPNGGHALRVDPWLSAPGNATTLKWHTAAGPVDYNYSRGNNVWAYEDRTAPLNTGSQAKSVTSTTALPNLTFDFTPDYTQPPTQTTPVPNQQFNITNLFYWNNVMHDVMYIYGLTEPAANFQSDNMGRGGLGNDHVLGEAQDIGGTNNANFATPADGGNGRMQMYLWTLSAPQRDGDVDNGVICHEFGHGISNRFTGGGTSGCLGNAEQMGEGWGDYNCLMFTQNWAASTLTTGFTSPRGIGTYVLNQPTTGLGIRSQRYCTDFTINNKVYAAVIPAAPHDRGEIWCATLWDMTWNIINQVGVINPNLYDLAGGGGNNIAFKLVNEGMRLQQCNPGFISGRNAILAADQALYGGAYNCAIWEAFRRRGMGAFAAEGSTNSVSDQTPDFTPPIPGLISAVASVATVPEGQNISYTNTITSCNPATGNYTLRDTLPNNVTIFSVGNGGTVAGNVVSWPVTQGAGSATYGFVVTVNPGSYFPPATLLNEPVAGATIPATWTVNTPAGTPWTVASTQSHSAPNAFYVDNLTIAGSQQLTLTNAIALPANSYSKLSFWGAYNTEAGWDGGVVEISVNGGPYFDAGPFMIAGGYNGGLGTAPTNALSGRAAFTGQSTGFVNTIINLASFAGQSVKFRFWFGSDDNTSAPTSPAGWWVDDIVLDYVPAVNMRTSLFNPANTRISYKDMVTEITQFVACAPVINTNPTNVTICNASSTTFTCVGAATGGVTYQWQLSTTGAGGPWNDLTNVAPYSNVTTSTMTINPTALSMNGYMYRCVVTGGCAPNATSTAATLTVLAASIGGTVTPANSSVCGTPNGGVLTLSGHTGTIVRWESATVLAGPYTPIPNITTSLTFTNITQTTYYRAVIQVNGCAAVTSSVATVTFNPSPAIMIVPDPGTTLCQGDPVLLTATGAPTVNTFCNPAPISIPIGGNGTPYPSNIVVAGLNPTGVNVQSVILTGVNHTWGNDVDVLVQSPTGQNVILMADIGGIVGIPNATYTFNDAGAPMNVGAANPTGTYHPTNPDAPDNFPVPGPGSISQTNPAIAMFGNVANHNGTWRLYVVDDDGAGDAGSINGGWCIVFSTPAGPIVGGTFSWSPAAGLNQTTGNPVGASPAVTTTYTVLHDNGAGCVRQASITININTRPAITSQPANATICNGSIATFTAAGTGTGATYQWQESTTGPGGPWINLSNIPPYSGVTTTTLTINPVTLAMNNNRYRLVVSGTCPPSANSNGAILTVLALPNVTVTPTSGCGGVPTINGLLLTASGANTYTWAPLAGLYTDPLASVQYTGTNTPFVYAAPFGVNTTYVVTGTNTTTGCSNTASALVLYTPPAPNIVPSSVTMCLGDPAVLLKRVSPAFTSSFTSGPVNINIPDGPILPPIPTSYPATVSNITVSGIPAGATITNMRARFNATHAFVADLIICLKAPNGSILNLDALLSGTNNPGVNFTNTTIGSAGVNALSSGSAPWNNLYKADAAGVTFTALGFTFPGGPVGYIPTTQIWGDLYSIPNGVWSVGIYDAGNPDAGVLNNWTLEIDYILGVPSYPAVWNPPAGLFSDANASIAYVAGTRVDSVWTKPTPSGVYPYTATVNGIGPNAIATFTSTTPISIPIGGNGNPYPSNLNVTGLPAAGTSVQSVRLTGVNHTWGNDVDIMLQSPSGQNVILMSDVGGIAGIPNATYTFSDAGSAMNLNAANPTGTYRPTNGIPDPDNFPAPGPGSINQPAPTLATFTGNMNGIWKLFVVDDDAAGDQGNITGGYNITFSSPTIGCLSPERTVIVTVNQPTSIVTQPGAQTICTDKVATFTVAVTGTGPFSYQWQESIDGGNTYNPISNGGVYSGATSATLTITAPPLTMSGYVYRCIITGAAPCAPVTSFFRILTVNPLPTITIGTPPYVVSLFPGMTTTITSTVSPFAGVTFTWLRDGIPVSGANTGILNNIGVDGIGSYQLRVTDVNGCTNISNTFIVKDSVSAKCFIYPNPTDGIFDVRYYSAPNNVLPRSLTVFDGKGDRMLTQFYTVGQPYGRMRVDMRKFGKGLYWVEIGDRNGTRLTMCRVVIQ